MAEPIGIGYAGWQPKKCINCGWTYPHPKSDCWAHYDFDCPACNGEKTLKDDHERVDTSDRPFPAQ